MPGWLSDSSQPETLKKTVQKYLSELHFMWIVIGFKIISPFNLSVFFSSIFSLHCNVWKVDPYTLLPMQPVNT